MRLGSLKTYLAIAGLVLCSATGAAAAEPVGEKESLAQDLAVLFRSARGVISDNQTLINDASKGDKGLSGDKVIAGAKEKYLKTTGHAVPDDRASLAGQARAAMFGAIKEVMDQAQPLINAQGKGFKGFLPAVFAKQVADRFTKRMEGKLSIKLTAPPSYVRNRSNRPDAWESSVLAAKFASAGWEKNKTFGEMTERNGQPAYRLMLPEYYGESCMSCHGTPKGERDITGGKKEGAQLGELGGAISVAVY
jgi:hypothetical protein